MEVSICYSQQEPSNQPVFMPEDLSSYEDFQSVFYTIDNLTMDSSRVEEYIERIGHENHAWYTSKLENKIRLENFYGEISSIKSRLKTRQDELEVRELEQEQAVLELGAKLALKERYEAQKQDLSLDLQSLLSQYPLQGVFWITFEVPKNNNVVLRLAAGQIAKYGRYKIKEYISQYYTDFIVRDELWEGIAVHSGRFLYSEVEINSLNRQMFVGRQEVVGKGLDRYYMAISASISGRSMSEVLLPADGPLSNELSLPVADLDEVFGDPAVVTICTGKNCQEKDLLLHSDASNVPRFIHTEFQKWNRNTTYNVDLLDLAQLRADIQPLVDLRKTQLQRIKGKIAEVCTEIKNVREEIAQIRTEVIQAYNDISRYNEEWVIKHRQYARLARQFYNSFSNLSFYQYVNQVNPDNSVSPLRGCFQAILRAVDKAKKIKLEEIIITKGSDTNGLIKLRTVVYSPDVEVSEVIFLGMKNLSNLDYTTVTVQLLVKLHLAIPEIEINQFEKVRPHWRPYVIDRSRRIARDTVQRLEWKRIMLTEDERAVGNAFSTSDSYPESVRHQVAEGNWRLPTVAELLDFVKRGRFSTTELVELDLLELDGFPFWTSSVGENSESSPIKKMKCVLPGRYGFEVLEISQKDPGYYLFVRETSAPD